METAFSLPRDGMVRLDPPILALPLNHPAREHGVIVWLAVHSADPVAVGVKKKTHLGAHALDHVLDVRLGKIHLPTVLHGFWVLDRNIGNDPTEGSFPGLHNASHPVRHNLHTRLFRAPLVIASLHDGTVLRPVRSLSLLLPVF